MDYRYLIEIFAALIGIFCIGLSFVMLMHWRGKKGVGYFSLSILSAGLWILSVYFADISTNLPNLVFWTKLASVCALFYVFFFVIFGYSFRHPGKNWKIYLALILPILANTIYLYRFPLNEVYVSDPFIGFSYDHPVGGILSGNFSLYLLLFLIYYMIGYVVLLWKYGTLPLRTRLQIKYILIGTSISIIAAALFDILLPLQGIDYLYALGPACTALLILSTVYAIAKHNLLEIKVVIQRGVIYSILIALVVGFYLLLLFVLRSVYFEPTGTTASLVSAIITTLLGIFGAPLLERILRKITDKVFFKERYDYSKAVQELVRILNEEIEFEALVNESKNTLQKILKTKTIHFLFLKSNPNSMSSEPTAKEELLSSENIQGIREILPIDELKNEILLSGAKYYNAELIVPLVAGEKVVGLAFIPEKLSGEQYSNQDIDLLNVFSFQAGIALEKARLLWEVQRYSNELEQRVEERTFRIQQLQQEQKNFMNDISHSLQTPLTVIKGELDFLKMRSKPIKELGKFEKSVDEISRLIYNLFKLAKIEMQDMDFKKERVNLSALLEDIIEYLDVLCKTNDIKIIKNIQPDVFVLGNIEALETLVTNLTSNAIKYIANKKIITITLQKTDHVILSIKDTGIGIEKEDLKYIFNRFYRAGTTKSEISGTGLGLAICKKIAENHGGNISVESVPKKETTFTIKFPLSA
ncbi:MAG: ATP-binding protein [Patescibacteria group bacterium]|mgnify:FL=1